MTYDDTGGENQLDSYIFDLMETQDYENIFFCQEKTLGLKAIIAIHEGVYNLQMGLILLFSILLVYISAIYLSLKCNTSRNTFSRRSVAIRFFFIFSWTY